MARYATRQWEIYLAGTEKAIRFARTHHYYLQIYIHVLYSLIFAVGLILFKCFCTKLHHLLYIYIIHSNIYLIHQVYIRMPYIFFRSHLCLNHAFLDRCDVGSHLVDEVCIGSSTRLCHSLSCLFCDVSTFGYVLPFMLGLCRKHLRVL